MVFTKNQLFKVIMTEQLLGCEPRVIAVKFFKEEASAQQWVTEYNDYVSDSNCLYHATYTQSNY